MVMAAGMGHCTGCCHSNLNLNPKLGLALVARDLNCQFSHLIWGREGKRMSTPRQPSGELVTSSIQG